MSKFAVVLDTKLLNRTVQVEVGKYTSIRATLDPGGWGQVVCNRRPRNEYETEHRITPIHGMFIANILRQRGTDPFQYKQADIDFAQTEMASNVEQAIADAQRTGRSQANRLKIGIYIAASHLAESARELISEGDLTRQRPNKKKYLSKKAAFAHKGFYTSKYGIPPPVGIATGRFIEKIDAEFRRMPKGITGRG